MARNYETSLYNQFEELLSKFDDQSKIINDLNNTIKLLRDELKEERNKNDQKDKLIEKILLENQRLKNKKDSSNSSKPSGTNGFKKVITNRREKTDKQQGGQSGHQFFSLNEKTIDQLVANGAEVEVIEVGKNKDNLNEEYKTVKVIDIEFKTIVKEYRYYPDEAGRYNIPNSNYQSIVYGNNLKGLAVDLMYEFPNSTDGVKSILNNISNGIDVSKGSLINWSNTVANTLTPEIECIEEKLLASYYQNADESTIKIDGENANCICSSNSTHTRLWISKTKTHQDLVDLGFLSRYIGVIIKDGTDIYNGFGHAHAQCISHILRYLKGVYDFNKHKYPKLMSDFLVKCIKIREKLIGDKVTEFDKKTYNALIKEYEEIIKQWKKEWMYDNKNSVYDDERKLLSRMEDSDKEQILYFLKDFKIPPTNNQAEADQRPFKIKQKIGKVRSDAGANNYAIIRSCVNTYKKNDINVLKALISALNGDTIII